MTETARRASPVRSLPPWFVRGLLLAATKKFVTFLEGIVFSEARETPGTKEGFHASHREIRRIVGWGMGVATTYDGIDADKGQS